MKTILVFGTFNPITNAHIEIGKLAKNAVNADNVFYIPCADNFFDTWKTGVKSLDTYTRLDLIAKVLNTIPGFYLFSEEAIGNELDGKTFNTVEYIKHNLPNVGDIYICMGTDKFEEIDKWYNVDKLVSENKFIIINRDFNKFSEIPKPKIVEDNIQNFFEVDNTNFNTISSTQIRNAYVNGNLDDIKDAIPDIIYNYLIHTKNAFN